jgi:fructose-1-phosphate kinase PfkB-like protein
VTAFSVLSVAVSPALDRYGWYEQFDPAVVNRPNRVEVRPGGKALNGARVLRELGVGVTAVVPLHPEEAPWWIQLALESGIEIVAVETDARTRVTMTCIDLSHERAIEIYEPSLGLAEAEWVRLRDEVLRCLDSKASSFAALMIAGSRPGTDRGVLAELVQTARERSLPVYVDGVGPAISAALGKRPTMIKVNQEEAGRLLGADASDDLEGAATALVAMGAGIAVVTAGTAGAVCADGSTVRRLPGPTHPGPYPGGSGDAFFAGFLTTHVGGADVFAALEHALACAEENARSPYAGSIRGDSSGALPDAESRSTYG